MLICNVFVYKQWGFVCDKIGYRMTMLATGVLSLLSMMTVDILVGMTVKHNDTFVHKIDVYTLLFVM